MRLLLDTHVLIWWDSDPVRLPTNASTAIRDPANEVWVSVVSIWEMAIKSQLGKLTLRMPLADIVSGQLANGLQFLDVRLAHVLAVEGLPSPHRDPFDRMLAAQAITEGFELVTADRAFSLYPVKLLW